MSTLAFPSIGTQVLSALIHFGGVTILSHCLSRRLAVERLTTIQGVSQLPWARAVILLVFLDSWLFLFTSGILIFGVGLDTSSSVCSIGIFLCIVFYGTSKALIYMFLIEKVHIVWGPASGNQRLKSPVYLLCCATTLGYVIIIILLFVGRISFLHSSGQCMIGLKHFASIPLIAYDLYVNIFLTFLFLWPLWRSSATSMLSPAIRHMATRTLAAATIALLTSATNIFVLTLLHGRELGWVCLGSCGTDVVINAIALFWVTRPSAHPSPHSLDEHAAQVVQQAVAAGTRSRAFSTGGKRTQAPGDDRPLPSASRSRSLTRSAVSTETDIRSLKMDIVGPPSPGSPRSVTWSPPNAWETEVRSRQNPWRRFIELLRSTSTLIKQETQNVQVTTTREMPSDDMEIQAVRRDYELAVKPVDC